MFRMYINILQGTPIKYYCDENITSRILGDLLSNGVKFTFDSNKDDNIINSVEDTGISISEEDQRFIFQTFDASASQIVSVLCGSCSRVSLTLSSKLISLFDGSLSVAFKLGRVSKFTAVFSFKSILIPYIQPSIRQMKMQIFWCFDYEHIDEIHKFPDFYGCQFTNNVNNIDEDALSLISVVDKEESINMSISLTKKYQTCHVIVYNNKPFVNRNKISQRMHYSTFFYFPTDFKFRYDYITQKKIFISVSSSSSPHMNKSSKRRVLLADDNPTNCLVMSKILTKIVCDHFYVNTGHEVLDTLEKDPFYDILLMDQRVPDMDDLTASKIILSKNAIYSHIPIIAVTTSILKEDKIECLNAVHELLLNKTSFYGKIERCYRKIYVR